LRSTFGFFPFGQFEEMGKQNMAMFEQALKMLSPYGNAAGAKPAAGTPSPAPAQSEDPRLHRLESQIDALRRQLEALSRKE
jgi:polyhydroxyalkanoate synthesis regulator protein